MAATVTPNKSLKALKSHSWWDTHLGPRHSKWLAENLDKMDHNYKRMLKLIEGDGDSFAKKAEMYYQRRPELLSHVEDLYRMYKLLAERHENLTLDLRKNLVPDLQDYGGSEPTLMFPPQDPKMAYRKPGLRAAGFDVFLGSGRSSVDRYARGDEAFSISDSETESDVSSLYSYPGISGTSGEEGLQGGRMFEPDIEHSDEGKLRVLQQDNDNRFLRRATSSGNFEDSHIKVLDYEEELKMANEKIRLLEEEIASLKMDLHNSAVSVVSIHEFLEEEDSTKMEIVDTESITEPQESSDTMGVDVADPEQKIPTRVEDLRITKGSLRGLDKEVVQLRKEKKEFSENIGKMQDMLKVAQKDAVSYKVKLETEKRQASKLQERIARYKASLRDRENEVRDLKEVISDANLKYQLHAEISRLDEEKNCLEEKIREWEVHCHTLETQQGKMKDEIEHLKADVEEKTNMLETLKLKYEGAVRKLEQMDAELRDRNDQIMELEKHMKQLVDENEGSCKVVKELRSRVEELREEVERQKVLIMEGAEGKREAIRQLCFSLEHYRNGYQQLRQAFVGHKHPQVFAS